MKNETQQRRGKASPSLACSAWAAFRYLLIVIPALYLFAAWMGFQYRNPKANQMSFYRDFVSVIRWEKLEEYQ